MLGFLIRLLLVGALVGLVGGVGLAVLVTPKTCTPDTGVTGTSVLFARWDAFVHGAPPQQVTFDEAQATAALQEALTLADVPIAQVRVHFCADGTAELAFGYGLGPVEAHGLAVGTIPAGSPLRLRIVRVVIGGLPTAVTDLALDRLRTLLEPITTLSLSGPIDRVQVSRGAIVIFHD
ncbi:MAG: hypothetical protein ACHQ15_01485 [Candidatus Limnocylindrales bacterium]